MVEEVRQGPMWTGIVPNFAEIMQASNLLPDLVSVAESAYEENPVSDNHMGLMKLVHMYLLAYRRLF